MTADTAPVRRAVQRGLWFEEFETDVIYEHRPGRTVTETDNVLFTTLTMNTQALHLDAAVSDQLEPFHSRLVNSMFTLSTLVGLSVAQLTQGTIVANLGFSDVSFPRNAMFHGDALYAETVVTNKRESKSRPGEGIVSMTHTGPQPARRRRRLGSSQDPRPQEARMTWQPGPGWLFCPADRPERYAKAAAAADVVILDLEDAVAPADKPAAREALRAASLDPEMTVVRVSAAGTVHHELDLAALEGTGIRRIMLAKTEGREDLRLLSDLEVVALVETPLGVHRIDDIVTSPAVIGVMWGADDLIAGLGGTSSRGSDGGFRDVARHARSRSLVAAKAFGLLALDSVHMDIPDLDGLAHACADAVGSASTRPWPSTPHRWLSCVARTVRATTASPGPATS